MPKPRLLRNLVIASNIGLILLHLCVIIGVSIAKDLSLCTNPFYIIGTSITIIFMALAIILFVPGALHDER